MELFSDVGNDFDVLFGSMVNQLAYVDRGETSLKLSGRLFVDVLKLEDAFGVLVDEELDLLVDALNGDMAKEECDAIGVKIDTYWKTLQLELAPMIDGVLSDAGFDQKPYEYAVEASWYGSGEARVIEIKPRYFEWS